jgi:pantoate--beta-alanine ligase
MMPPILRRTEALRDRVRGWKAQGARVAVVPTMGALHAGHLSLVNAARRGADRVIVTIFVNPRQFNNPGDLAAYPRKEETDAALLAPLGVDAVFAPAPDEVYPAGFATNVSVSGVSEGLCGAHRPGHFDGVATVVTKLFGMTLADQAYFGEKDWQQLQVVRRLVMDLNIPVQIVGCETVREPDGLALSSRNQRLTADNRALAPVLHQTMTEAAHALSAGLSVAQVQATARQTLARAGFGEVEYFDLREAETLAVMDRLDRPARLLAAVWLGDVRLIDNIGVTP